MGQTMTSPAVNGLRAMKHRQVEPSAPGRFAFVAPRHPDGSNWPWLTQIGPMRRHRFHAIYIDNTLKSIPKATSFFIRWQYWQAMRAVASADLVFLFSTDIGLGMSAWPSQFVRRPKRIYVGFTQDGAWSQKTMDRLSNALQRCDAITVFSEDERQLYVRRYRLNPDRVHLIPIHTDESDQYRQYPDERPIEQPYVLSLGSPNRRFTPIAQACNALNIPLVIITRPWHRSDSLDELARLGAAIITDADKHTSLTYLKHARFAAMCFETPDLPGAFTTLIHAMFMRVPSVVTACLGMSDYVVDQENGLVVPHGDQDALTAAIHRVWTEPDLHANLAELAFRRANRNYSLQAAAGQFHDLAMNLLSQNR